MKKVLEGLNFDLVLCGARSRDTSDEFMAAALAEKLTVSLVTRVVGIEFKGGEEIIAYRKLERGERETYVAKLPAVITIEERLKGLRMSLPLVEPFGKDSESRLRLQVRIQVLLI